MRCDKHKCPVFIGFEVYFQGEDDEKLARKKILPMIKKFYETGEGILEVDKERKEILKQKRKR